MGGATTEQPIAVGHLSSLWQTVGAAMLVALVLPGFGVLILLSMVVDEFQWGGLVWVTAWALVPFVVRSVERQHSIAADVVVSSTHRRVVRRPLGEVVALDPVPLRLPAARITFQDGGRLLAYGRDAERFITAVLHGAPGADDRLPTGKWLRRRRVIWFFIGLFGEANSNGRA